MVDKISCERRDSDVIDLVALVKEQLPALPTSSAAPPSGCATTAGLTGNRR
ncbi:hypothetical protein ACQP2P_28030 [Dactylosporangium sp. CA-139114]|uniref:hypothetical protein n=1 Tax=Dactylosporangium sp. CA-139114 TaxID=3239931 RepID=UPI003D98C667